MMADYESALPALSTAIGSDHSDLDLLIEFEGDRIPGLFPLAAMELELGEAFGREIELLTY